LVLHATQLLLTASLHALCRRGRSEGAAHTDFGVPACHAEVVVFDGVAYHQSTSGVKVLKGDERTPFMSVTLFDKQKCKHVSWLL
jgi:alpha-acetolactate decarboxylase